MPQLSFRPPSRFTKAAFFAALALLSLNLRSDAPSNAVHLAFNRLAALPRQTLWTWERSEDLLSIDPKTTAVAYLEQTILLNSPGDSRVVSKPRRQRLTYPSSATNIAVVRIEARPGLPLDAAMETQTVELLLDTARQPGIAALQIDFDATRSQRAFYRNVLRDLRNRMPAELPLSITALASWCSYDDWIANLPVDEAVPMLFRMEPDRRRAGPSIDSDTTPELHIREPLCMHSVGISTHEAWPRDLAGRRIYIFPDRGWRQDLSLLAKRTLP